MTVEASSPETSTASIGTSTGLSRPDASITNTLARRVLVLGPLAVWVAFVVAGIYYNDGTFQPHPLVWFDKLIFRQLGALVPFLFYAPRVLTALAVGKPATWAKKCLQVYVTVTFVRMALYYAHISASAKHHMSDHIFLGASVVACLQLELVCSMNDIVKAVKEDPDEVLLTLTGSARFVMCLLTMLLTSADMFYTAKYYHERDHSATALLVGLGLFQAPVLWLLAFGRA